MSSSVFDAMGFTPRCCGGVASPSSMNNPYSFRRMDRSMARSRKTTLWSLLPVKYINAAPQFTAGTARRSTCNPLFKRTLDLVSPETSTLATNGCAQKNSMTGAGCSVATNKSTSPMVSRPRRKLPANSACVTPLMARNCVTKVSAMGMASPRRERSPAVSRNARFSAMFCNVLAPMRGNFSSAPLASCDFKVAKSVTPP